MNAKAAVNTAPCLLDPGFDLTLRPMRYLKFYEMYRAAIKNTWTVEEVDFQIDFTHMEQRMSPADRHLIRRLVAFFATGDSIVANNLVLNLYRHINAPEARMFLSRQLYEEALHVQFYLTLLDNYIPDHAERAAAFAAIENIPAIRRKAEFCQRWIDSIQQLDRIGSDADRRSFLLNLTCFAACIEGLFFFGAFAYVYYLRSRGLLPGLAAGTNWVFRDESGHMAFAFTVIDTVRREEPQLFDDTWAQHTSNTSPTSGSRGCIYRHATVPRTRSRSWSCRTPRNSPTSSNGACPPTRSRRRARLRSMSSSETATEIRLAEIVFPQHCNHLGTLFGGQALAWMDKAAFLVSSRYSGCTTVTARSEGIDFKAPIHLGDTVEIVAGVQKVVRSSMTVEVKLLRNAKAGEEQVVATTGHFVMVAVDEAGRPVEQVSSLII